MAKQTKTEINLSNKIVLRSVRGKVGLKALIQPCQDPKTGKYAECVKRVDSNNDMILSEKELNDPNRLYFIKESDVFTIVDGTTFDLDDVRDRFIWEAIQYCPLIAPDYYAKDQNGNSLINGTSDWNSKQPRFGIAELYVERPGVEANRRVSRKKLKLDAETYIFNDDRGYDGRVLKARLLGHRMDHMPDADVTDYLLQVAERDPEKIIKFYNSEEASLRLLLINAKENGVLSQKQDGLYYSEIKIGSNLDLAVEYLKNDKVLTSEIKKETFPELEKKTKK